MKHNSIDRSVTSIILYKTILYIEFKGHLVRENSSYLTDKNTFSIKFVFIYCMMYVFISMCMPCVTSCI